VLLRRLVIEDASLGRRIISRQGGDRDTMSQVMMMKCPHESGSGRCSGALMS